MDFDNLLSRLDDETLQKLVGGDAVRLLMHLDPKLMSPSELRNLVVNLRTRAGLLLSPEDRRILFDFLRPKEAESLRIVLGLDGTDNYAALRQARFRHGSEREQILFDFFGLSIPREEVVDQPPSTTVLDSSYGLFVHQRQAAREIKIQLTEPPHRVMLHMPTGSGKTRTAMSIISDHLRATEPTVVVWLAYSEELCEQAASEFERTWKQLGDRSISVHRFWGDYELDLAQVKDGIVVAGLAKLYNLLKQSIRKIGTLGQHCSLVIIDEAHMAVAETYQLVLDSLVIPFPHTALLGLTATPGRTWADIEADEQLSRFFARRKVTLKVAGFDNPVEYLIHEGYLARASFRPLFHNSGLELSDADLRQLETLLDIPPSILKQLAADDQRNLRIVLEVESLVKQHSRILLFATTVEHADLIAAILQARGIQAYSVTGSTPSSTRTRIIADYMNPEDTPKVLCNYGVLTTGFDAPRTSAALIARPTKSLVLYSQMVGRAMRGTRAGGNEAAEIVTVVDQQLPGFGSFAEAFYNWEDVWED